MIRSRAHPRRRGEHSNVCGLTPPSVGSSPQARGTHSPLAAQVVCDGLIPAGAGNTGEAVRGRRGPGAHPRRRGEHRRLREPVRGQCGSSPQARGTRSRVEGARTIPGLIPAGAGNTRHQQDSRSPAGAHPRRRGEHSLRSITPVSSSGSSPQARGTPTRRSDNVLSRGLIPAGAGNTTHTAWESPTVTAHPRRRGEHGLASG